jgi:hypothetical protein
VTPADDSDGLEAPKTVIDRRREPRRFSCPSGHHDWHLDTVDGRQVIVCRGCLRGHDTAVHRRLYDAVAGTHLELAAEHLEVRGRTWDPEGDGDDDRRGDGGVTAIRGP